MESMIQPLCGWLISGVPVGQEMGLGWSKKGKPFKRLGDFYGTWDTGLKPRC
jgi:hypothetical protein